MSGLIVAWFALAWCVVHLLRHAARGRFYRSTGQVAPAGFVRNVAGLTITACVLSVLVVGVGRPLALGGVVAVMALLGFQIARSAAPRS
jgi:hypothetical protein